MDTNCRLWQKSSGDYQTSEYLSVKTIVAGSGLNEPTGIPVVYELDTNLKYTKPMHFQGNQVTLCTAMETVAAQYSLEVKGQEDH